MKVSLSERTKRELKNEFGSGMAATPASKTALLIWLLPEIEAALANGHSYLDCMALLEEKGVKYTMSAFTAALYRARKMPQEKRALIVGTGLHGGRSDAAGDAGRDQLSNPRQEKPTTKQEGEPQKGEIGENAGKEGKAEPKEKRTVLPSGDTLVKTTRHGVVVSSVEKKSSLTNSNPSMDDFV